MDEQNFDPNHGYDPHELDRQWAARLAWELNVPEPNLARLDSPLDYWRNTEEPLVTAAAADYLEEWFRL